MNAFELMNLNRHERRKIGKQFKLKIPGLTEKAVKDFVNKKVQTEFMKKEVASSSLVDNIV